MKPSIPKGTRDFNPAEMLRRNYLLDTIRSVYVKYGYQQIETPAMENIQTLTGKYGDEGDQLLFRILNSRLHDSKKKDAVLEEFKRSLEGNINSTLLTERALRYDLTVPFARYVVMHQNEISFPFKRYQIQPVWRADRPQKGRYREFYQCDADVIGSDSLLNEAELLMIIDEVFRSLELPVAIKVNNRKVLSGIAELIGEPEKIIDITVAIDKIDKIGKEKVIVELKDKGISADSIEKLLPFFEFDGSSGDKFSFLKKQFEGIGIGLQGVDELEEVSGLANIDSLEIDITLARGLNYYTGTIIEVVPAGLSFGSVCGGGRYDDLTGIFGLPDVSGVGISFGIDRIYDVLMEAGLFKDENADPGALQLMFVNFGAKEAEHCIRLATEFRKHGISTVLYPDTAKMKKQMSWANNNNVNWVALVGEEEISSGYIKLKNMTSGEQHDVNPDEAVRLITGP